jgi:hypothetical protein
MALGSANEIWVRHQNLDGSTRDEFRPMNLTFELVNNDVSKVNYDISLAEPTMRWGFIGPKRTLGELWIGDFRLVAGPHSRLNTKRGEEVAHCEFSSWEWYLQNRHYPFDGRDGHISDYIGGNATTQQGFSYINLADPATIINDLIDKINSRPNAIQIFFSPEDTGLQYGIQIPLGDTTSIFDYIQQMSEGETGGFDWFVDQDRRLFIFSPNIFLDTARTDPTACGWIFDHFHHPEDLIESEFDNAGPLGTHIMGTGQGTGSSMVRSFGYDFEQGIFGRWDMTVEFSDIITESDLINLTQERFSAGLYPQHNIPVICKPDEMVFEGFGNFWNTIYPGQAVWLRQDFEAQNIDGAYRINTMRGSVDNNGDLVVALDTEQINPQGRPGTPQG